MRTASSSKVSINSSNNYFCVVDYVMSFQRKTMAESTLASTAFGEDRPIPHPTVGYDRRRACPPHSLQHFAIEDLPSRPLGWCPARQDGSRYARAAMIRLCGHQAQPRNPHGLKQTILAIRGLAMSNTNATASE